MQMFAVFHFTGSMLKDLKLVITHKWSETYLIGCAVIQYDSIDVIRPYEALTYCNYGPSGNIVDEAVYKTGKKPASQCPAATKLAQP